MYIVDLRLTLEIVVDNGRKDYSLIFVWLHRGWPVDCIIGYGECVIST